MWGHEDFVEITHNLYKAIYLYNINMFPCTACRCMEEWSYGRI